MLNLAVKRALRRL